MSKRCEQLRRSALRDGLDSRAGLAWRVHCRSCEDCRTELYILETLQRQAQDERAHIGRDELNVLMDQIREVQSVHRGSPRFARWTFRLAGVAVALFFLAMLPGRNSGIGNGTAGSVFQTPASNPKRESGQMASAGNLARAADKGKSAATASPAGAGGTCEHRILELRRRVNRRREMLQKQIEHELGSETDDQGAYDPAPSAVSFALV